MSQNLMLEFNNMTPQQALTGQSNDFWSVEPRTVDAVTGSQQSRPDVVESMMRFRLLAKQAVLQGIMEDRFAQAARIRQHAHRVELLLPGQLVEIWKQPLRKDVHGWRGPAEILSIERRAGSAIVRYQGQPLIVPLNYLRKHVLTQFFTHNLASAPDSCSDQLLNPKMTSTVHQVLNTDLDLRIGPDWKDQHQQCTILMDVVDHTTPGKQVLLGYTFKQSEWRCHPSEHDFQNHKLVAPCKYLFGEQITEIHGLLYGTSHRRLGSRSRCPVRRRTLLGQRR